MSRRTSRRQRFYDVERRNRAFVRAWRTGQAELELFDDVDEGVCTRCGGAGEVESDDSLWDGADYIDCPACEGTGARDRQWMF